MEIYESKRKDKRFMAIIKGKKYHFGLKNGSTYIDHKDELKRQNYIKRHIVNEDWGKVRLIPVHCRDTCFGDTQHL